MEKILGNDNLIESLKRIAARDQAAQAYILSGAEGTGKRMVAEEFRKMLKVSEADTIYVTHEKPALISVDDIRTGINQTVHIKPYDSEKKLYIVDEAEKMNAQAQNALLKTLEEPPAYVVILLLTTNQENFLQTILSRAVILTVRPLPWEMIAQWLKDRGYEAEKAETAARLSGGSIGNAVRMMESEEFAEMLAEITAMLSNAHTMDTKAMLSYTENAGKHKENALESLEYIRLWFLDVLLYKTGASKSLLTFKEQQTALREQSKRASYAGIDRILRTIDDSIGRLNANVNFELTEELLLMAIREVLQERKNR